MSVNNLNNILLKQVIDDLKKTCILTKYMFCSDDGTIISSTMSTDNTAKMGKIVKFYSRQMKVNNYFLQKSGGMKLFLYRISNSLFLIFISDTDPDAVVDCLMDIFKKYSKALDAAYREVPDSFKKIVKYLILSQSGEMGPEPIACYPDNIDEGEKMKISMKSMLLLTSERDGAIRGIPATIPFIEYYAMGIIFLFDVPDQTARGGAFDSCISILVDEAYRPAIYENMFALENVCIEGANMIRNHVALDDVIQYILMKLEMIDLSSAEKRKIVEIEKFMKEQLKTISS
ncbi:MAG: hypothetical protein ACFFCS_10815 [Candidatus Hodarchaeota archaeon]